MHDVFITGTFRNEWNKQFIAQLVQRLEQAGFSVFSPQRDSRQDDNWDETFADDVAGLDAAMVVVAVGEKTQTANWGFELGYAYQKKPIVILCEKSTDHHLMTKSAATKIIAIERLDTVDDYLDELIKTITLLSKPVPS